MKSINWSRLINKQKFSQVPVTQFCKQEGVSPSAFYYHVKKLRTSSSAKEKQGFVEVSVIEQVQAHCHLKLEVLENGCLRFQGEGDMASLFRLLAPQAQR